MNIQNNSNVSFEARRILNVRKAVQGGADEVIDVFALGKEDKKFMARCNATLQGSDRAVAGRSTNRFKEFFSSFLSRLSGKSQKDCMQFDDMTYLMAVKDGEVITGIAETSDYYYPASYLEKLIPTQKDKLTEDSLSYGLLTELKDSLKDREKTGLMGVGDKFSDKADDGVLLYEDFNAAQREIRAKNSDAKFEKVKDTHEYDLEDFLGIKDIETEIMD
ncbi:MAG: hypothetical protein NC408_09060 [Candidatus Gastranaerophilales bacterium]|nr:hypothetical protein [Candidatus Gastranaerophilales bacterium]MCM1072457.1 hypothetical protein [Bacteroides sp.]